MNSSDTNCRVGIDLSQLNNYINIDYLNSSLSQLGKQEVSFYILNMDISKNIFYQNQLKALVDKNNSNKYHINSEKRVESIFISDNFLENYLWHSVINKLSIKDLSKDYSGNLLIDNLNYSQYLKVSSNSIDFEDLIYILDYYNDISNNSHYLILETLFNSKLEIILNLDNCLISNIYLIENRLKKLSLNKLDNNLYFSLRLKSLDNDYLKNIEALVNSYSLNLFFTYKNISIYIPYNTINIGIEKILNLNQIFNLLLKCLDYSMSIVIDISTMKESFKQEILEYKHINLIDYLESEIKHTLSQVKLLINESIKYKTIYDYYNDIFEYPLQPLFDNLSSQVYSVFENDKIKYELYGKAIELALLDIHDKLFDLSLKEKNKEIRKIIIGVFGAGRGGIVNECKLVIKQLNINADILAIEKNISAYNCLKHKYAHDHNIIIINNDIRVISQQTPIMNEHNQILKFDLIISELLGSFGDNELSPECLFKVEELLSNEGVMIPQKYTSYLQPVSSKYLHDYISNHPELNYDSSYVLKPKKVFFPFDNKTLKCFEFQHFNFTNNYIFNRKIELKFLPININNKEDLLEYVDIHGFIGYFDALLYKNVYLSTNPINKTENMYSWFPIYFPSQNIIRIDLKASDLNDKELKIEISRLNCKTKSIVWYEWIYSLWNKKTNLFEYKSKVHNENGKYQEIKY